MRLSAIAALDRAGAIGLGGRMPWHLPRDLKRFRTYTWSKPIIMGRKTFLSLAAPLAGRHHIVLSRAPDFAPAGCQVAHSVAEALAAAEAHLKGTGGDEAMIIGGGHVFEETLPLCDRAYLTVVDGQFEADTFFPLGLLRQLRWRLIQQESCGKDERNPFAHWFLALERSPSDSAPAEEFDLSSWPSSSTMQNRFESAPGS
jgi:dihydrofolate reductase